MTEDEQTKNAFTRIEDVSPQNVPLIAGPRDVVEGFDELNGTIYRSESTGELYTLYPETKTKQEPPLLTAAKAVGDYISDPSLPSLEETSEFAKEAVKGAYEPFRKIASGDSPTYGDLTEVLPAGMSGAATRIGKPLDTSVVSSGGAGPAASQDIKTPQRFQAGEYTKAPPSYKVPEAEIAKFETLVASPASSVVTHRVAKDLEAISNLGEIPVGKFIDLQEDLAFVADSQRDKVIDSFLKNSNVTFGDLKDAGYKDEKEALRYYAMGVQFSEANKEYQRFLQQNNLLHQSDIRTPLQKPFEISYRDPVMEVAEGLPFPKNGMKGSDFIKALDKSPAAKSALYNSADLGIDKGKFYTKEDLLSTIEPKTWKGSFAVQDYPRYRRTQIQEFDGMEADGDYKEILFNVERKDKSLPTFDIPEEVRKDYGSYHFPENTLAHARVSTNENFGTGQKELLVHEFQSDYLQKGAKKAGPGADINALRVKANTLATQNLDRELLTPDVQAVIDRALNDPESNRLGWIDGGLERELREDLKKAGLSFDDRNALLLNIQDGLTEIASADTRGATKLPVGNVSDAVENLLDGVLGYAQSTDIDKVFIPSLEQIVGHEGRFKPGSFEFFEQTQPGSFFYETYVTGLDKATRDLSDATNATVTREVKTTGGTSGFGVTGFGDEAPQPRMYVGLPDDVAATFTKDMKIAKLYNDMLNDRITEEQLLKASGLDKEGLKSFRDNYKEEFNKASKARDRDWLKTFKRTAYNDAVKIYGELKTLDTPGTMIDLSEAKTRFDFTKPKMAKGGLVKTFAEGGMIEDEQMNRLMQEGGIADDGMAREPVTGNEIPPGSMASEVRDDIPAQLSEGEYVVPADVVRFFGVRFFEDLRNQAKQGLAEMDADGRIGGAPVSAQGIPAGEGDEELTPEEEQMLMEALGSAGGGPAGMAYGGMVQQPAPTPYQDQATMYQMPEGMGGPMGMQEGGLTRDGTSTFDRTQFTLPEASGAFESRKYINPTTGEEKTVQFLNGVPMGLVPEGFVPWTPALAEQAQSGVSTETPKVEPVKTERDGRDRDTGPTTGSTGEGSLSYDRWAEKNADAITSDPYSFGIDALSNTKGSTIGKGLGIAGAVIGGPIGAIAGLAGLGTKTFSAMDAISDANAALSEMAKQGLTETDKFKDLQAKTAAAIKDLPPAQQFAVESNLAATGKNKTDAVNRFRDSQAPTATTGSTVATPGRSIPGDTDSSGGVNRPDSGGSNRNIPGGTDRSGGVTRSGGRDQQGTASTGGNKSSGATPGGNTGTGGPGNVGGNRAGGSAGASSRSGGAFAPGGLVTKKASTTKKPKKGLAS